ncbi:MAG: hypothetical protein JO252_16830 [Planctomycetaceae bacterium]|nr:hypothetical protein [Planctomycetaceae bacterium]MBV8607412.1 hypothetical protein [Singulisphaera sp.]
MARIPNPDAAIFLRKSRAIRMTATCAFFLPMVLTVMVIGVSIAGAQAPRRDILAELMRQKLKHSQSVLVGLAVEDYGQIRDNAMALKKLSEDALAKAAFNPDYIKRNAEFATIADELARRARDEDLNGVTLSYVKMTLSCVECHKFLRDHRVLDPDFLRKD